MDPIKQTPASDPKRITFTTSREAARFELTEQPGKLPLLSGYAMCWGKAGDTANLSDDRGGYRVRLLANSAAATEPCFALANHDFACTMGSTKSGTLKMEADEYGLKFTIDPADTTFSRDIIANARRGDMGMSFGMLGDGATFETVQENGMNIRNYSSFQFDEISCTSIPAFSGTACESEFAKAAEKPAEPPTVEAVQPVATPLRNKLAATLAQLKFRNKVDDK